MLQLGHAGEGVEMVKGSIDFDTDTLLQLGHAGEGVEIGHVQSYRRYYATLQLGHAGEGVEIFDPLDGFIGRKPASIGPRR